MANKKQVREQVDISDQLNNLHIEKAIDLLKGLSAEYPDAWLNLTREYEHGESYEKLYLEYNRDQTPIEVELDATNEKCRRLQTLKDEATAFKRNGASYPRSDELRSLAADLGFLALAPNLMHLTHHQLNQVVRPPDLVLLPNQVYDS